MLFLICNFLGYKYIIIILILNDFFLSIKSSLIKYKIGFVFLFFYLMF